MRCHVTTNHKTQQQQLCQYFPLWMEYAIGYKYCTLVVQSGMAPGGGARGQLPHPKWGKIFKNYLESA